MKEETNDTETTVEERGGLSASASNDNDRTQNHADQVADSCGNASADTTLDTTAHSGGDAPKQKKAPWWQDALDSIKPGDTCWYVVDVGICPATVKSYHAGMYVIEEGSVTLVAHPSRLHKTKTAALTTLINGHREEVYNHEATVKVLESMLKEEQEAGNA